ncbi:hypothetical protein D3C83_223840 [compost metagenome]
MPQLQRVILAFNHAGPRDQDEFVPAQHHIVGNPDLGHAEIIGPSRQARVRRSPMAVTLAATP